jgi:hypothetical protein
MLYRTGMVLLITLMGFASSGAHAFAVSGFSSRMIPGPQVNLDPSVLLGQVEGESALEPVAVSSSSSSSSSTSRPPSSVPLVPPTTRNPVEPGDDGIFDPDPFPPEDIPELVEEIVEPEEPDLENVPPTGSKEGKTDSNGGNDDYWLKVPLPSTLLLFALGLGLLLRGTREQRVGFS